jgi:hypothetical protein
VKGKWTIAALVAFGVAAIIYFLAVPIPTHAVWMNGGQPIAIGQAPVKSSPKPYVKLHQRRT